MNDNQRNNESASAIPVITGFALGALVGAGLALLFAPSTGEVLRGRIGDGANKLKHDAKGKLDQARDAVADIGASARSAIEAGRDAYQQDDHKRDGRGGSRPTSTVPGA